MTVNHLNVTHIHASVLITAEIVLLKCFLWLMTSLIMMQNI